MFVKINMSLGFLFLAFALFFHTARVEARPPGWVEQPLSCEVDCRCPDDSPLWGLTIYEQRINCAPGPYDGCCLTVCNVSSSQCTESSAVICHLLDERSQ